MASTNDAYRRAVCTARSNCVRKGIVYVRVSTAEQELGVEAQRRMVSEWAQRHAVELVGEFVDQGVSGGAAIERRPGLLAALDHLKKDHDTDVLVIAKRDRLARDVVIGAVVERLAAKAGATVESADGVGVGDGPEARLMRTLVDAFAEYERALVRSRTRAALASKRARGEALGGQAPLGYQHVEGRLETNDTEAQAVAMILDLRSEGLSVRAIARQLNEARVPGRGSRWHPTSVARTLKRLAAS